VPVLKKIGTASRYLAWLLLMRPENFSWLDSDPILPASTNHLLDDQEGLVNNEMAVRYDRINAIVEEVEVTPITAGHRLGDRLDKALLHPVFGICNLCRFVGAHFPEHFCLGELPDGLDRRRIFGRRRGAEELVAGGLVN
jgi:Fe2+ transport system protein B